MCTFLGFRRATHVGYISAPFHFSTASSTPVLNSPQARTRAFRPPKCFITSYHLSIFCSLETIRLPCPVESRPRQVGPNQAAASTPAHDRGKDLVTRKGIHKAHLSLWQKFHLSLDNMGRTAVVMSDRPSLQQHQSTQYLCGCCERLKNLDWRIATTVPFQHEAIPPALAARFIRYPGLVPQRIA
jgi:hypothetical protein